MPDPRLGLFYALNFGGLGIALPYLAPWLAGRGVDATLTGVIAAAPSFAMLVIAFALGTLADRLPDRRTVIVAASWGILAAYALLLAVRGTLGIGIAWTLGGMLLFALLPIADAAALSRARRLGTAWGPVRACGSAGFIVGLALGGQLVGRFGADAFVPMLVAAAACRALASLALPRFGRPVADAAPGVSVTALGPGAPIAPASASAAGIAPVAPVATLRHVGFLAVLAGAAMINASHAFLYTFGLLHWTRTGQSESAASALWVVSILAEVLLLWRFAAIARRVSARGCLLFGAAVAALRWTLTATDPAYPVLIALQMLHAVSFGLVLVATASFIARRVEESVAARAQALAATFNTACMAVLTLASGALYDDLGAHGYRVMAGVCVLGAILVAASYRTDLEDRPERG